MSNNIDNEIAELADAIRKLRKYKHESANADINSKSVLLFWYASTRRQFQCHILGTLLNADTLYDVVVAAKDEFIRLYNSHFGTAHILFGQCDFIDDPSKWSKERLLKEFLLLRESNGESPKVHGEKRRVGRPKTKVHKHDLDPIREHVKREGKKIKVKKHDFEDEQVEANPF
jgi:hypothetical protein